MNPNNVIALTVLFVILLAAVATIKTRAIRAR